MIRRLILNPLVDEIKKLGDANVDVEGLGSNPLGDAVITVANPFEERPQAAKTVILDCLRWGPDRGTISASDSPTWIGGGRDINRLLMAGLLLSARAQQRWTASSMLSVLFLFFSEFHDVIGRNTGISTSVREIVEPRLAQQAQNMYEGSMVIDSAIPINVVRTQTVDNVNAIRAVLRGADVSQNVNIG